MASSSHGQTFRIYSAIEAIISTAVRSRTPISPVIVVPSLLATFQDCPFSAAELKDMLCNAAEDADVPVIGGFGEILTPEASFGARRDAAGDEDHAAVSPAPIPRAGADRPAGRSQ